MFLLDSDSQLDCLSNLLEAGNAVNAAGDVSGQSPAHLAACGGDAFCLLWLLQTGADANQQDSSGETPIHKAARAGSLECISVLVASDARLEICNNDGKTAEDLAWSHGFLECSKLLSTLRMNRRLKSGALGGGSPGEGRRRRDGGGTEEGLRGGGRGPGREEGAGLVMGDPRSSRKALKEPKNDRARGSLFRGTV